MIQLYSGPLLIVGMTSANIKKLTEGMPLIVDVSKGKEPIKKLIVFFGESKPAILAELEKAGVTIPDTLRESAQADPS